MAARRPRPEVGAEGVCGQARLRLRDGRQYRRPQSAHQHRRLPDRLLDLQRHAAGRVVPEGRGLAVDRPVRPAPPAARGRTSRAASRRHLLHGRPRSPLGDQAAEDAAVRAGRAVQEARHRSGDHPAQGAREHPVPLHHAEAARSAVRTRIAEEARSEGRVLRRHRDDAPVPSLRRRRADGRRLFRADLRQHADGSRDAQTAASRRRLGDHLLPAVAARDDRSGEPRAARSARRIRQDRPRASHHADQGILHAALPRARSVRA
jgi:hypothetical protein